MSTDHRAMMNIEDLQDRYAAGEELDDMKLPEGKTCGDC